EYHPAYLPDGLSILVGKNAGRLDEPMLFCMPFGRRPDSILQDNRELLTHKSGAREISELRLWLPSVDERSEVLSDALSARLLSVKSGPQFALEIVFDATLAPQTVRPVANVRSRSIRFPIDHFLDFAAGWTACGTVR